jgi:hypothetical protein
MTTYQEHLIFSNLAYKDDALLGSKIDTPLTPTTLSSSLNFTFKCFSRWISTFQN